MSTKSFAMAAAAAAVGVILAGLIMSQGRGSIDLLAKASDGFDT